VVERELGALNELPGLVERGLQLVWGAPLVDALVGLGVSVERGARGVQSTVRTLVATPLARWLAEHPEASNGIVMLAVRGELESIVIDWVDDAGFFRETLQ
jgi:ATP-dependent Clp protease ATP-binding subunit ClpA